MIIEFEEFVNSIENAEFFNFINLCKKYSPVVFVGIGIYVVDDFTPANENIHFHVLKGIKLSDIHITNIINGVYKNDFEKILHIIEYTPKVQIHFHKDYPFKFYT